MALLDFNPVGIDSVIVKLLCPECRKYIDSEVINVPDDHYWGGPKASDTRSFNYGYAYCEDCEINYHIEVVSESGGGGGYIEIDELDEEFSDIEIIENYDESEIDAILSNTEYYQTFENELDNLKALCLTELKNSELDSILKRQVYIGVITCLETYLSDAFINSVMSDEKIFRKFVHIFKDFEAKKIPLNDIFKHMDNIKKSTKKALLEIIYHNLSKISIMYLATFGLEFPPFGDIQRFIQIRHDLVHRNGKTKDGTPLTIDNKSLGYLFYEIEAFISCIDQTLNEKIETL